MKKRVIDPKEIQSALIVIIMVIVMIIVIIIAVITKYRTLSDKDLNKIANEYSIALNELCNEYGLKDAVIDISDNWVKEKERGLYVTVAYVTSEEFSLLTGEKAFEFAKKFEELDEPFTYQEGLRKGIIVSFATNIKSNNGKYFDYEYKNGYEYLKESDHELVIYKDNKLITNIFDNKEYETDATNKATKMEILTFINGKIDILNESNMSNAKIEEKADEVWKEAEAKFNITENDILDIMGDMDLLSEYYGKSGDKTEPITSTDVSKEEKIVCWTLATDAVENKLKSPRSAKFAFSAISDGVTITKSDNTYTVISYVDAENSYGASIRTNFIVTLEKDGYGDKATFVVTAVLFDE